MKHNNCPELANQKIILPESSKCVSETGGRGQGICDRPHPGEHTKDEGLELQVEFLMSLCLLPPRRNIPYYVICFLFKAPYDLRWSTTNTCLLFRFSNLKSSFDATVSDQDQDQEDTRPSNNKGNKSGKGSGSRGHQAIQKQGQ